MTPALALSRLVGGSTHRWGVQAEPELSGQATFGFVSKYHKGAQLPISNTEFQFDAAGLSFDSETYDLLVGNQGGTNAQVNGSGTVNGGRDSDGNAFKFMLGRSRRGWFGSRKIE